MILKLVRTPAIYLVGFMGSGKTTVGRLLAERLGWKFIDLDAEIEAEQKKTIAQIFDEQGEEEFRRIEAEAIRKQVRAVRCGHPVVMALGGGAFTRAENITLLEDNGVTIWLDCPLETARKRVGKGTDRPLAKDPRKFEELYQSRLESYSRAEYRIASAGSPQEVVASICNLPIFRHG